VGILQLIFESLFRQKGNASLLDESTAIAPGMQALMVGGLSFQELLPLPHLCCVHLLDLVFFRVSNGRISPLWITPGSSVMAIIVSLSGPLTSSCLRLADLCMSRPLPRPMFIPPVPTVLDYSSGRASMRLR